MTKDESSFSVSWSKTELEQTDMLEVNELFSVACGTNQTETGNVATIIACC